LAKRVVCIEVGVRFTRICETTDGKQTPQVFNCVTFPTPQGAVEDGYIRDKATMANIIRKQMTDLGIKTTDVIFTLNSTKIASREVFIPVVKENKIKSIVDMQASEYFPIDISEYNISYYLLNDVSKVKSADKKMKLLLLAAPNNLVQSYYNLADAAGLHITSIDYIGNSFYQLAKRQLGQGVNISIHINENTSIINIVENENLLLQRIVPYGTNEIVERVKENSLFNVNTDEEAIQILCKEKLINYQFDLQKDDIGLSYATQSESYDRALKEIKAKEDITDSFRFLMNHVIRVIDYFTSKNSDKKIGVIYISGLGARFQGTVHLFKNELGYDCRRMENLFSASFVGKNTIPQDEQTDYISCIGSSIAPVNFAFKGQKTSQGALRGDVKNYIFAFVFSVCLSVVFVVINLIGKISADITNSNLKKEINDLLPIEQVFQNYNTIQQQNAAISSVKDMTESQIDQLDSVINDLEKYLPNSMTVERLNVDSEGVALDIKTDAKVSISKMLVSFQEIKYIDNVSITSISEDINQPIITDNFEVRFQFCEVEDEGQNETGEDEATDTETTAE